MKVFTLKDRKDFLRAAKEFKVVTNGLILQAALNLSPQTPPCCFVGYTATKKLGKAHIRNKIKRRLRAAVSLVFNDNALEGVNYVVIGRYNTIELDFAFLVKKLRETDKHIYYINGSHLLGEKYDEYTIDSVHPNDLGFHVLASNLKIELEKILKEEDKNE